MNKNRNLRLEKIKELVQENRIISTALLGELLCVSSVTIRNDLSELEKENVIYRMHGKVAWRGAPKLADASTVGKIEFPFTPQQIQIGQLAKKLVEPQEWIFIGCGITCAAVALALQETNINVITNNLYAALILTTNPSSQVMLTGGYLSGPARSFLSGDTLVESLRGISVSKAFIGAYGVDLKFGFSISNLVERSIYQTVRPIAQEVIVVVDSSKCGRTSVMSIGQMKIADCIVTDEGFPQEYVDYCIDHQIRLIKS